MAKKNTQRRTGPTVAARIAELFAVHNLMTRGEVADATGVARSRVDTIVREPDYYVVARRGAADVWKRRL